jgi:glucose-6-phosphate isomerase
VAHKSDLGDFQKKVEKSFLENQDNQLMQRLWAHDYTLWKPDPAEISNRLGWLDCPENMHRAVAEIMEVVDELRAAGFTHALLLGMGGSSLAPEVFCKTFGIQPGYMDFRVLDSTDPTAVLDCEADLEDKKAIYIVSTKSGGTVETISFMKYFYAAVCQKKGGDAAGSYFLAITDPGSGLEKIALSLNFRKIFVNDPNIGGRFSALSYFGLVAAAIIGIPIEKLLNSAGKMAQQSKNSKGENSPLWLGTALGVLAEGGRDKLTLILSPKLKYLGAWIEQLIAESSGKEGRGILPIDGEAALSPKMYGDDRVFVSIGVSGEQNNEVFLSSLAAAGHPVISLELDDLYELGGEYFRWEIATAVSCKYLKVNPFDQPNVEAAKVMARQMMAEYSKEGILPQQEVAYEERNLRLFSTNPITNRDAILPELFKNIKKGAFGTYLAIQAYLQPTVRNQKIIQTLRTEIQHKYQVATTVGFGPRYLHSTGQLHKGDRGNGVFLQLIADRPRDAAIPDEAGDKDASLSFAVLIAAQALGDREALLKEGRKVITIDLGAEIESGIQKLLRSIG